MGPLRPEETDKDQYTYIAICMCSQYSISYNSNGEPLNSVLFIAC